MRLLPLTLAALLMAGPVVGQATAPVPAQNAADSTAAAPAGTAAEPEQTATPDPAAGNAHEAPAAPAAGSAGAASTNAETAQPATSQDSSPDGTAPSNSGSTGWTGGTGGSMIGTNPSGALTTSKTWQPPTARGIDLKMGVTVSPNG